MKTLILNRSFTLLFVFIWLFIFGQNNNFGYELSLNLVSVFGLPSLHTHAYTQHEGKWLNLEGRKDGLHARQPFNTFPNSKNNSQIFVLDVNNNQVWSSDLSTLPISINEQLQSIKMNFYQDVNFLFIIGGYGFSESQNNHITYPYLTHVEVSGLMNSITSNQPISSFFNQIQDNSFAVTGGHLKKIYNIFYLEGGYWFDGRYNLMGNPTFTEKYINQIRKFMINNEVTNLIFSNYSTITDPVHLHRRDNDLLPQIFPNGEPGFTISLGVFQVNPDIPFLYPVDINETGYTSITTFNQYISKYLSATANFYGATSKNMQSLFFGGMSPNYYQFGKLVQDDFVPYVKTISRLTRDVNRVLTGYQLPIEMLLLKGADSEFIPNLTLLHYTNKVIKLNEILDNTFKIGHIFGGIQSNTINPFSANNTGVTIAFPNIYEIRLTKNNLSAIDQVIYGENPYRVIVFPNSYSEDSQLKINSPINTHVHYFIIDTSRKLILERNIKNIKQGKKNI